MDPFFPDFTQNTCVHCRHLSPCCLDFQVTNDSKVPKLFKESLGFRTTMLNFFEEIPYIANKFPEKDSPWISHKVSWSVEVFDMRIKDLKAWLTLPCSLDLTYTIVFSLERD